MIGGGCCISWPALGQVKGIAAWLEAAQVLSCLVAFCPASFSHGLRLAVGHAWWCTGCVRDEGTRRRQSCPMDSLLAAVHSHVVSCQPCFECCLVLLCPI